MAPPGTSGLRWSPWNLLLIVPLLWLVTPIFNRTGPELFGMPFYYWFQFLGIVVGVLSTSIVYLKTRDRTTTAPGEPLDVDDLDEGAGR
jgi:hypothetical protein